MNPVPVLKMTMKELREYVFVVSLIPSDQERKRNMRIRKGF